MPVDESSIVYFDPSQVVTVLQYLRATHYCALAGVVVLLYDYFLCLPSEIRYVWHSKWNLGKLLYLLNRYIPTFDLIIHLNTYLFPNPTRQFCVVWFYTDLGLSWISLSIIELLLALRTIALFEKNGLVSISISTVAVLTMFTLLVLIIVICARIDVSQYPVSIPSVLTGCYYTEDTNILAGVWICPIIFESTVCLLTLAKGVQHLRSQSLKHSPLFAAFYKDGFVYFFFIFTVALTNLFVWFLVPQTLGQLLIVIYRASMCVLASRIMLNLRRAGTKLSRRRTHLQSTALYNDVWDERLGDEGAVSHVSRLSTFMARGEGAWEMGDRRRFTVTGE